MIKFTKEEISLAMQVAEKHMKEIEYGDWYYYSITKNCFVNAPRGYHLSEDEIDRKNIIPIWTISDCLEFLEENGFTYTLHFITKKRGYELILFDSHHIRLHKKRPQIFEGKTRKIPCLKAVLAVLEDNK